MHLVELREMAERDEIRKPVFLAKVKRGERNHGRSEAMADLEALPDAFRTK